MIRFGGEFREYRLSQGFSQCGAAKRIGINPSTLCRIEKRNLRVDQRWVEALSDGSGESQQSGIDGVRLVEAIKLVMSLGPKDREVIGLICGRR